jgi:hypothetical protein
MNSFMGGKLAFGVLSFDSLWAAAHSRLRFRFS